MTWLVTFAVIFMVLDACGEPATQSNLSGFMRGSGPQGRPSGGAMVD
jgi:hypothetical protein